MSKSSSIYFNRVFTQVNFLLIKLFITSLPPKRLQTNRHHNNSCEIACRKNQAPLIGRCVPITAAPPIPECTSGSEPALHYKITHLLHPSNRYSTVTVVIQVRDWSAASGNTHDCEHLFQPQHLFTPPFNPI